jgi:protein-L-isoaspartate(D-aspartate) O-methyltransferase
MVARGALWSPALIAAFRATPRHLFLDRWWNHYEGKWREIDPIAPSAEDLNQIYADRAVTTRMSTPREGETMTAVSSSSQPSLMSQMLEDLNLAPGLRVLEIGAGTGYNAALLAHVVGKVISLDVDQEVLADARRHLVAFPDRDVQLVHADGRLGYPDAAPFDRVMVTAATDDLEPAWLAQVRTGGILQAPLDLAPGLASIVQGVVRVSVFEGRLTRTAFFMPLRDEGTPGRDRNTPAGPIPAPERLQYVPAPWANWPDARTGSGAEFLPPLAMLAWLEGLTIDQSNGINRGVTFGFADLGKGEVCWMGPYEWRISGSGEEMGRRLWGRWLELGAPRVNEWRLRAVPLGGHLEACDAVRAVYTRQARCCEQVWELVEPRRRMDEFG